MGYEGRGRNVVEKKHQNLHSSRAYRHNRSALEVFWGTFLRTISKVQVMAKIAIFLSRQKKRMIATSRKPSFHYFYNRLQLESGIIHICTFSMVYL